MTERGKDWLIQTLDPFHDTQRDKAGFPDVTNGNSFIQQVTLTESFPITTERDFHIFTMPQATVREMFAYPMVSPTVIGSGPVVSVGQMGPLNVWQASPGNPTFPVYNPTDDIWVANIPIQTYAFDLSPYLVGDSRVVSLGFEVINTGPELLKSGAITTYRAPQTADTSFLTRQGEPITTNYPVVKSSMPPATAGAALLLNGSQQWEAYDGAYLVDTMYTVQNPIKQSDYRDQFYIDGQAGSEVVTDKNGLVGYSLGPREDTWFPESTASSRPIPFNTAGAYASGCALGTTLTVVLKAYIECFPTANQKSYVTLTSPSTPYDPQALELYSRAAYHLKPGVKQMENPGGEYWGMVKGVLNEITPNIGAVVQGTENLGRQIATDVRKGRAQRQDVTDQTKNFGTDQHNTVGGTRRGRARKGRRR